MQYSYTLQKAGDVAGALAVMEEASARAGEAALYVRRVERLRERLAGRGWLGWRRWFTA